MLRIIHKWIIQNIQFWNVQKHPILDCTKHPISLRNMFTFIQIGMYQSSKFIAFQFYIGINRHQSSKFGWYTTLLEIIHIWMICVDHKSSIFWKQNLPQYRPKKDKRKKMILTQDCQFNCCFKVRLQCHSTHKYFYPVSEEDTVMCFPKQV